MMKRMMGLWICLLTAWFAHGPTTPAWAQTPTTATMATTTTTASLAAVSPGLNARDFGVKGDGHTDDTAALQSAIDRAAALGQRVCLPAGEYLIAGAIKLKAGVALVGENAAPESVAPRKGTILLATGGRGNEDAPPLFVMENATTVRGLTIYYPEQKTDAITPYPWTFRLAGYDNTVEDVTLINSYNGFVAGPDNNVRHRIRSVAGCVLRRGIQIDNCTDIGRVENVQFHTHWWTDPVWGGAWEPVYKFMGDNLEAFVFGRTDWEYVTNNFVFPAKIGYRFIQTPNGASNGHLTACGADSTQTAVQVEALQPMGLLITGGQFVSFLGDEPVQVRILPTVDASVRLVNCAFWGNSSHNAIIDGKGYASFSDCYFSNWGRKGEVDPPLVVARGGKLQISNSTFATTQPAVELGPKVRHAIITGNNGQKGVKITGATERAIIRDNEPAAEAPPTAPPPAGTAPTTGTAQ